MNVIEVETAAKEYHVRNPGVFTALVEQALKLRAKGIVGASMLDLFGAVRWGYLLAHKKRLVLPDIYAGFYSREIMDLQEGCIGIFAVRDSGNHRGRPRNIRQRKSTPIRQK